MYAGFDKTAGGRIVRINHGHESTVYLGARNIIIIIIYIIIVEAEHDGRSSISLRGHIVTDVSPADGAASRFLRGQEFHGRKQWLAPGGCFRRETPMGMAQNRFSKEPKDRMSKKRVKLNFFRGLSEVQMVIKNKICRTDNHGKIKITNNYFVKYNLRATTWIPNIVMAQKMAAEKK